MTAAPTEIARRPPSSGPSGSENFSNRIRHSKVRSPVGGGRLDTEATGSIVSRDTASSQDRQAFGRPTIMSGWDTLMARAAIDCDNTEQSREDEGDAMESPASSLPSGSEQSQNQDEGDVEEIPSHDLHYEDCQAETANSSRVYSGTALRNAFELGWQQGSAEVLGQMDSALRNFQHWSQTKNMGDSGAESGRMMVPYQSITHSAAPSLTEQFTSAFGAQGVNLAASAVLTGLLTAGKWGVCAGLRALRK